MAESPPETKRDEQFPLLMVTGAGDGVTRPRSFSALWSLTSRPSLTEPKRSLLDRFPGNNWNNTNTLQFSCEHNYFKRVMYSNVLT